VHPICCLVGAERLFSLVAVLLSPLLGCLGRVTLRWGTAGSDRCVGHIHGGATAYGRDRTKPPSVGEGGSSVADHRMRESHNWL